MKNYIDFPCLWQNNPPNIFLEHFLKRLYSVDARFPGEMIRWMKGEDLETDHQLQKLPMKFSWFLLDF